MYKPKVKKVLVDYIPGICARCPLDKFELDKYHKCGRDAESVAVPDQRCLLVVK